jgi:hypothetical protein
MTKMREVVASDTHAFGEQRTINTLQRLRASASSFFASFTPSR